MGCNKYPHMFAPMTIKGVTFKNRVLASPITTNRIVDPRASTSMRPRPGAASRKSPSPRASSTTSMHGVMSTVWTCGPTP